MSKHTPGPWSIKREEGDINIVSDAVPYVAQVFPCPAVEVMDNANLISAAPDLLEALCNLIHWVEPDGSIPDNLTVREAISEALAAIDKATGSAS